MVSSGRLYGCYWNNSCFELQFRQLFGVRNLVNYDLGPLGIPFLQSCVLFSQIFLYNMLLFKTSLVDKRLKYLIKYSKRIPMKLKLSMIGRILRDHNNLFKQIDEYNQYWKKYLTLTYIIYVFLVCFLSYAVFISHVKWFLRIEYSLVLSAHILLVLIITYSTSTIWHFNERIFRDLFSICVRTRFSTLIKLKVRKKHNEVFKQ